MAILSYGPLGPVHKKLGKHVGRRLRGKNVLSMIPAPSKKPASAGQTEVRQQFAILNETLAQIDILLNIGFHNQRKKGTASNAAFAYNQKKVFTLEENSTEIDFSKLTYSLGKMSMPIGAKIVREGDDLVYTWLEQNQSAYCLAEDKATFLLLPEGQHIPMMFLSYANRGDRRFSINMPKDSRFPYYHVYMSFNSADGKMASKSVYLGTIE